MFVTPEGIIIDVRAEQEAKLPILISNNPEGRFTDVSDVHLLNVLFKEVIPVAEISMDCRSVEFLKTSVFIAVTSAPRVTLAGIGPVKPVKTPFTMIGSDDGTAGLADSGLHCKPWPTKFTALTVIA